MQNSLLIDTIKGIKHEGPPVWFMRQAGRILPSYLKIREQYSFHELMRDPELTSVVTLLPVHDLGVDAAILFSDILVIPEAMGMSVSFTDKGPVFDVPLTDAKTQITTLKPDLSKLDHIYKAIDVIRNNKPADIPLIGFCGAPFTTFCYMVQGNSRNHTFTEAINLIYKDRQTSLKLLDMITDMSIEYALSQVSHKIDVFQLFETHAGLIPSDLYIEIILPFVRKITAAIRSKGIPVIYFPKDLGNGMAKITYDIADFISIDWQMPITEARKMIDSRVGLQGNIDQRIFTSSNKDILIKELEKFLAFGRAESNWIFNAGHGVSPDNLFENVKFVIDWVKTADWKRN